MEKVDVMTLLSQLEERIEKAHPAFFRMGKCIIDKEELMQIIGDIRLGLPDEIKSSREIINRRDRILADANKCADEMIRHAEEKIVVMVNEHQIMQRAIEQSQTIMNEAAQYRNTTEQETLQYCEDLLTKMESDMVGVLDLVRQSKKAIHNS